MRRPAALVLVIVLAAATAASSGCRRRTVEVQSGTQVLCTYGEVVSQQVETLEVPQKDAARYSVRTSTVVCDTHRKVEDLYRRAQVDIAAGNLAAAKSKLDAVVRIDPNYRDAASQRQSIGAGGKPATAPPVPAGGSGGGGNTPAGPVVNLLKYVPDTIAGYSAQSVMPDVLSVSRAYVPVASGDVAQLVIQAEQFKDSAQASARLGSEVKGQYPVGAANLDVAGRRAYFGTNNRGYAVVAVSEGAVLVIFEMYSSAGRPAGLKNTLAGVAGVVM